MKETPSLPTGLRGAPYNALTQALDNAPQSTPEDRLLPVWFALPDGADPARGHLPRTWWFERNTAAADRIDALLIALYTSDVGHALRGDFDGLTETPKGALTVLLLCDTLPRRLWQGHPRALAGSEKACSIALDMVRRGLDQALPPLERGFVYLSLLYSANGENKARAVALLERMGDPAWHALAIQSISTNEHL